MNESEFRDWARRAQGTFDERLRRLEEKVGALNLAPPRVREAESGRRLEELYSDLGVALKGGGVTAIGVSFITEAGGVQTGWASEVWDRYALAGAVGQLWLRLMDREGDGSAAGAAEGRTDEGPLAREVGEVAASSASAPAGGIVA